MKYYIAKYTDKNMPYFQLSKYDLVGFTDNVKKYFTCWQRLKAWFGFSYPVKEPVLNYFIDLAKLSTTFAKEATAINFSLPKAYRQYILPLRIRLFDDRDINVYSVRFITNKVKSFFFRSYVESSSKQVSIKEEENKVHIIQQDELCNNRNKYDPIEVRMNYNIYQANRRARNEERARSRKYFWQ